MSASGITYNLLLFNIKVLSVPRLKEDWVTWLTRVSTINLKISIYLIKAEQKDQRTEAGKLF